MQHPDYNSPAALKAFLDANGMAMQKKFGQNFMVNPAAREKIAGLLSAETGDEVWEIGPGLGCMTEALLEKGCKVRVFEIDRGFISMLHSFFSKEESEGRFSIVEGDVLKTWKNQDRNTSVRLFGNLPYNIAATFIADTIASGVFFDRCVFTVQKEVTDRICAAPGTKNYSSFSVLCQLSYDVSPGIELAPGNFWPRPNVSSQAVLLKRKEKLPDVDTKKFVSVVHALFSSRRKTIANNIKPLLKPQMQAEELFEKAGLDKSERAENLTVENFVRLSQILSSDIMQIQGTMYESRAD
jgi:16S rRNA (adenine1518-N6/adenine1519-N6)-dimethyltransferase